MKTKLIITLLISSTLLLSGCCLSHDFSEATCTQPQTCTKCGETQGDVIPHTFVGATCTTSKTCSVCNTTEGTPLEHQWVEATTEKPMTCGLCGLTDGEPLPAETPEEKEVLTGEEISLDLEEESTEETDKDKALLEAMKEGINEGISPLAGTTSKHGYVYPDDYVECGPKDEDRIGDVESFFDNGWLTEEEYQRQLEFFKNPDAIQDIVDSLGAVSESERAGNTGNPPATGGAPIELPVLPETVPDGRICY